MNRLLWHSGCFLEVGRYQTAPDPNLFGTGKHRKTAKITDSSELADICGKKNLKEGSYQIVYPLNISARWMAYSPDVEYPLETLLAGVS